MEWKWRWVWFVRFLRSLWRILGNTGGGKCEYEGTQQIDSRGNNKKQAACFCSPLAVKWVFLSCTGCLKHNILTFSITDELVIDIHRADKKVNVLSYWQWLRRGKKSHKSRRWMGNWFVRTNYADCASNWIEWNWYTFQVGSGVGLIMRWLAADSYRSNANMRIITAANTILFNGFLESRLAVVPRLGSIIISL